MIMDRTLLFSDGQAVIADSGSTNVVDLGATGTPYGAAGPLARDIGPSDVPLTVNVTESFNNLTSLQISIQVDDNAAFSSATTVYLSPVYTLTQLAVGAKYLLPDSIPVGANERYIRLYYDITGTAPSTGKITAGVVASRQKSSGRY